MAIKVLALTRYGRTGASSRLRFLQYLPGLSAFGIDVQTAPFLDDVYLRELYEGQRPSLGRVVMFYSERLKALARARRFDLVWVEKEALPWLPILVELAALHGLPVVVDFDDAWHLRYNQSPKPLVRLILSGKLERLAKRADFVIVANEFLQDWAEEAGAARVARIPTVVDLARYQATALPDRSEFVIGWIGTPETVHYLHTAAGALEQLLKRSDTRLLLIGPSGSPLPFANVEALPWSEGEEGSQLQRIHVGIMPLPQGEWEHGKSAYKLVQYMAAGRPVVASPVGANRDLVREGVNGYFARTEEEWIARLEKLRGDRTRAAAMGQAARNTIEESFSLDAALPKLAEVLTAAAKLKGRRG